MNIDNSNYWHQTIDKYSNLKLVQAPKYLNFIIHRTELFIFAVFVLNTDFLSISKRMHNQDITRSLLFVYSLSHNFSKHWHIFMFQTFLFLMSFVHLAPSYIADFHTLIMATISKFYDLIQQLNYVSLYFCVYLLTLFTYLYIFAVGSYGYLSLFLCMNWPKYLGQFELTKEGILLKLIQNSGVSMLEANRLTQYNKLHIQKQISQNEIKLLYIYMFQNLPAFKWINCQVMLNLTNYLLFIDKYLNIFNNNIHSLNCKPIRIYIKQPMQISKFKKHTILISSLFPTISSFNLYYKFSKKKFIPSNKQFPQSKAILYKKQNKIFPSQQSINKNQRQTHQFQHLTNFKQLYHAIIQDWKEIQTTNKTTFFNFLNQLSIPKNNDQTQECYKVIFELNKLTNLTLHELIKKLQLLYKVKKQSMDGKYQQVYDQLITVCQKQIEEKVNYIILKNVPINDYFNQFIGVNLHQNKKLLESGLKIMNQRISQINQSIQLDKIYRLIFSQIRHCNWSQLKSYPNIIKYITQNFNIKTTGTKENMQILSNIFIIVSSFRLHLVGQRKIPICLKQIIKLITPRIYVLPQKSICQMIDACILLPAQFNPEFKKALIEVLLKRPTQKYLKHFPFNALSVEEINKFFSDPKAKQYLFKNSKHIRIQKNKEKINQTIIVDILKQLIDSKYYLIRNQATKHNIIKKQPPTQYFGLISYFFVSKNHLYLEKLKFILQSYLQSFGIQKTLNEAVLGEYIVLLQMFHEDKNIYAKLKTAFQKYLKFRMDQFNLGKQDFYNSFLQTLHTHIQNQSPIIQQNILAIIGKFLNKQKNNKNMQQKEIKILLQIIKSSETEYLNKIKYKIWQKVTKQDLQTICQYFILSHKKMQTQNALQQIIERLKYHKIPFFKLVIFLSSLSVQALQNDRGRLEYVLIQYFSQLKQPLSVGLKYINQLNRFLNILLPLKPNLKLDSFLNRLFVENLSVIQNYVKSDQGNNIIIINFLFKFQQIIPTDNINSPKNLAILHKIYKILQKLQEINPKPYVKIKLIEFTQIYRQYIPIPQVIYIKPEYDIKQTLKNAKNIEELSLIMFIFLKLECIQVLRLNKNDIVQYVAIITTAIRKSTLNIYQLNEAVKSLIYQIKVLKIKQKDLENCKRTISPILQKCLQSVGMDHNYLLMLPFLQYFKLTEQLYKKQDILVSILSTNKVNPLIVQYFIKQVPIMVYTNCLFNSLIHKIEVILPYFDSNYLQLLYFIQKMFYQCPQFYRRIVQKVWSATNLYITSKIEAYQTQKQKQNAQIVFQYYFGRYPLYLFCCIKSQRTNNKIFHYFARHILKNKKQFLSKIKENQTLKFINECILAYIIADNKQIQYSPSNYQGLSGNKILQVTPTINYSKSLHQFLVSNELNYKCLYEINGVFVPYYIIEEDQIIIVANKLDIHRNNFGQENTKPFKNKVFSKQKNVLSATNNKGQTTIEINQLSKSQKLPNFYNGHLKFTIEIYMKLVPNKKIRIWDDIKQEFTLI